MKKPQLLLIAGAAIVAVVGWYVTHSYQVFVVKTVSGYAGQAFGRGPSKWFATKAAAMQYASGQMGGTDFVVALVADRNGGLLEGFHGTWLTGEALDAIVVNAEQYGLQLDNTAAA